MPIIKHITAREIIDSRSNPTVEASVTLTDGTVGISSVPEGASKGFYEAIELRDNDPFRYRGQGVLTAVDHVNQTINKYFQNKDIADTYMLDQILIDLDGTENKSKLGANAILPVSMAFTEACAQSLNTPLYVFINHLYNQRFQPVKINLPQPTFNLINGGKHGVGNNIDFQEYHIIFSNDYIYPDALKLASEVFHTLGLLLKEGGYWPVIGDEGGYAPNLPNNEIGLTLIQQAAESLHLTLGNDFNLGLDLAANSFYTERGYKLKNRYINNKDLLTLYDSLVAKYKIIYLEDPYAEDDYRNWSAITLILDTILIVADDLICTNISRLTKAIKFHAGNAALIKPNQIGTISESFSAISLARQSGQKIIVSHRSGETEEDFIADFAVGVGADMVKFGAPNRGERTVKYNRLLAINEELSKAYPPIALPIEAIS